jgi:hypothetical protein
MGHVFPGFLAPLLADYSQGLALGITALDSPRDLVALATLRC